MRDLERKRVYDRERMACLYSEGQTWWQKRGRNDYDFLRSTFVRPNERFALALAALGADVADIAQGVQDAEGGKAQVRRGFAAIQARERFVAEHGECDHHGDPRFERRTRHHDPVLHPTEPCRAARDSRAEEPPRS